MWKSCFSGRRIQRGDGGVVVVGLRGSDDRLVGRNRGPIRELCERVVNVDTREDSMSTMWAHIEYGWNLNPEVGFEAAKSEVNHSVAIDSIDMLAAVVLVKLALQSLERDHARSVEGFLRFGGGVVVVVVEIRAFAEAWIRTAIGPK